MMRKDESKKVIIAEYEASVRYFKEHDLKKLPSIKFLRNEIADFISKKNDGYNDYRERKSAKRNCRSSRTTSKNAPTTRAGA